MSKGVTIADVATKAGVSTKTVSNVLNQTGRMSAETRRRVEAAITALGYHVNRSAQMLRSGATGMIGLAVPSFAQPFFGYFSDIMAKYAHSRGYGLTIGTYFDRTGGLEGFIDDTYRLNADGWIFLADRPLSDEGAILNQEYPIVLLGDFPSFGKADAVVMPNSDASEYATQWLLTRGCKKIGFVGAPPWITTMPTGAGLEDFLTAISDQEYNTSLRLRGYLKALKAHGIGFDPRFLASGQHIEIEDGEAAMASMLESGVTPDAIVCVNDAIALGAMITLRQRGIQIPRDVQVIGFDNTTYAQYAVPSLTSIDPFAWQYAQVAVDRLIERMHGDDSPARTFSTGYRFVQRQSTAAQS
ncbi:MAG: LacI family transcriptional regulator [Bifidobacteriaceae bacterium]|nr:LacI family transcriptional regulator [Bifidobacteriaceae bacterium]MCI1914482.1 LacI family transcriptional regulator [Bifidobacteriaceae bacterium]